MMAARLGAVTSLIVLPIIAKPSHKRPQPNFDRRARREPRGALQLRTVGKRFEDVDRTHRQQFAPGRLADDLFQKVEQGGDLDRLRVADVVDAVRRLPAIVCATAAVATGGASIKRTTASMTSST